MKVNKKIIMIVIALIYSILIFSPCSLFAGESSMEITPDDRININGLLHLKQRATAPANPIMGDVYLKTDGYLYIYSNSNWKKLPYHTHTHTAEQISGLSASHTHAATQISGITSHNHAATQVTGLSASHTHNASQITNLPGAPKWVLKWSGSATTVTNSWGDGLFKVYGSYRDDNRTKYATNLLTSGVSSGYFKMTSTQFTRGSGQYIKKIYRFE